MRHLEQDRSLAIMAFRQPTYHAPQRIYTSPAEEVQQPPTSSQPIEESTEWVLFSPAAPSTTDQTYTTSTDRTRTAGRSRLSDFGSLDTAAQSYGYNGGSEQNEGATVEEEVEEEEDGELDSLDSHLHEFRSEPSVYRQEGEASGSVLPTHDGLGSFRVDQTAMGEHIQEHLYAFERFNPRKVKRRRDSIEIGVLELENERAAEAERTRRIEEWRLEQSRVLVDEIQRETRRRKQSMSSERRSLMDERTQEDIVTLSNVAGSIMADVPGEEDDSLWNRTTRRFIRDLIGIDDDLLSIIFGEALPEEDDLSTTPPANAPLDAAHSFEAANRLYDQSSWEYRLLERIARELGVFVSQLSDHPGAFSTYLRIHQSPLPYAGLPVIPETVRDISLPLDQQASNTVPLAQSVPVFRPTLAQTQPVSIPQKASTSLAFEPEDATPRSSYRLSNPQPLSREEWERDLDIKMVFRYIRERFTSRFRSTSSSPTLTTIPFSTHSASHLATASTAETAARAARVRQNHPLVTRQSGEAEIRRRRRTCIERRTWKPSIPGTGSDRMAIGRMAWRGSSSCASELSARGKRNSGTGSSRHYWDFGPGSVGSGSLIASTGAMGSWGEV